MSDNDLVKRLRDASTEALQAAWRRTDGGQDLALGAILADQAADHIEELQASRDMWAQVSISWAERAERAEANLNIAMISLRAIADMDEGNVTAYIQKVDAIALDALDQIALKP